jgi:hypothetical protein
VSFATGVSEEKDKLQPVTSQKVHGLSKLPRGYRLAVLPSNADVVPNVTNGNADDDLDHLKTISTSSSSNIPQSLVALVQILYASYTLYQTRGDQLTRYGYAAFGLTVIPYIIMSFMNLLGNLLTPSYPTLYLVHSPELAEAQLLGAHIDGVVGKVKEVAETWYTSAGYFTGQVHHRGEGVRPILRRTDPSREEQDNGSDEMRYLLSYKDFLCVEMVYCSPRTRDFRRLGNNTRGRGIRALRAFSGGGSWRCFWAPSLTRLLET